MSGPSKKVVDVAFKASRTIDWDGMAKLLVSDEARKEFATLRRAFNEVNSQLETKFSQVSLPLDLSPFSNCFLISSFLDIGFWLTVLYLICIYFLNHKGRDFIFISIIFMMDWYF
jgi:hypothetical protein